MALAAITFAATYFAPFARKKLALLGGSLLTLVVLYGPAVSASLVAAHLVVYAVLHRVRVPPVVRVVAVQSPMIVACAAAVVEGTTGMRLVLPLGLLLFFWHWERLIMYYVDYRDGLVPRDLSPLEYLATFITPGQIPKWTWGVTVGQGFAYCNNGFYAENKNRLALSGLRIWAASLAYLCFSGAAIHGAVALLQRAGIDAHGARISNLVADFVRGGEVKPSAVLSTTLLDVLRWLALWGGIVHFKVGLWRVCGYRMHAYFDRPWLATNLVSFWARFTFHYREFLVRAFYYPIFFRFFKNRLKLRVVFATMVSVTAGNLVWGHVSERLFYRGMTWNNVVFVLGTWPYFLLLGIGISATEVYLLRKRTGRRRAPWTGGWRVLGDVAAAYATLQFYGLITIFARPTPGTTVQSLSRLVLLAFGVQL
jgi:hypothetical protein